LVDGVHPKKLGDGSMISWVACRRRDTAIAADLADRDGQDHPSKCKIALLVWSQRMAK
jgi:hypothetical protein